MMVQGGEMTLLAARMAIEAVVHVPWAAWLGSTVGMAEEGHGHQPFPRAIGQWEEIVCIPKMETIYQGNFCNLFDNFGFSHQPSCSGGWTFGSRLAT